MKLLIISYKECWTADAKSPGVLTVGGFPFQVKAISELFDATILALPTLDCSFPSGATPISGYNLEVYPLDMPDGSDLVRKLSFIKWLPSNVPRIWQEVKNADAVHALVPGDIGTVGIFIAIAQRKPLFVRHCGTWGNKSTLANRFLNWLLPRIAKGQNIVMATGGGKLPPCPKNPAVDWIFSTTISEIEWAEMPLSQTWRPGERLKLVSVSRLDPDKNTRTIIEALPLVHKFYSETSLDIVGDGPCLRDLKTLARRLGIKDVIRFHGRLVHEDVLTVLSKSHLFVFPTRVKEGFPKVVLEAFACGLPVIATDVSVIPHLIARDNGIMLKDTGPESVADAIIQIISKQDRLAKVSASARETSRQYTLERWQEVIRAKLTGVWGPLRDGKSFSST
jgi:glycosyltransferase involved in cell wall biosynthesis